MSSKRVVVTGYGSVSPLGCNVDELVDAVFDGRSGIRRMEGWEEHVGLRSLIAAPAVEIDEKRIPRRDRRSMSRMSMLTVNAAEEALRMAGLEAADLSAEEAGCVVGSTIGSMNTMAEIFENSLPNMNLNKITSMQFFQVISHTVAMNLAQYLGLTGIVLAPSAACATGLQTVGIGYDMIRDGRQKLMLCGGAEELHPSVTASFDVLYAASTGYNNRPAKASRPFDRDRDGLVCGEGSGVLLIEDYDHAVERNAPVIAEIVGFDTRGSGEHISQSSRRAMCECMAASLKHAGLRADEVDYINAHATSTSHGDEEEAMAIRSLFGDNVPVSSLKGHLGHTLGAAGAIELIVSLVMMRKSIIFPTLNLDNVGPECAGVDHVREIREQHILSLLKNAFAFGGINVSLVCKYLGDGYDER